MPKELVSGPEKKAIDLPPLGILINGRWENGGITFPVRDKYTYENLAEVYEATEDQTERAVATAQAEFSKGALTPLDRARVLRKAAELLSERREQFSDLIVADTGFTLTDASAEIERGIVTLQLCAEEAMRMNGETVSFAATPGQHDRIGFSIRVPIGVVCAITPFNSPLNTVLHKIGPALAAGNGVVLKPSGIAPLTAALLCQTFLDAGLPPGLLCLTQSFDGRVGSWLLANKTIAFYSFTGSTRVGKIVREGAGLRRVQLELGSIASTLVCSDADLHKAIPKIASASFRKAGQVCTSIQRLYVERSVFDQVLEALIDEAGKLQLGNPRDPHTRLGPMISEPSAERIEGWIEDAKRGGASVVFGGRRSRALFQPTIVTGARDGMRILDEEVFAPCVSVLPFDDIGDAMEHANNTPYGLAAGIFTSDLRKGLKAARALRFGAVHINETSSSRGDAMPFGGVKDSGFGFEGPKYAIREVTEERLITLNH